MRKFRKTKSCNLCHDTIKNTVKSILESITDCIDLFRDSTQCQRSAITKFDYEIERDRLTINFFDYPYEYEYQHSFHEKDDDIADDNFQIILKIFRIGKPRIGYFRQHIPGVIINFKDLLKSNEWKRDKFRDSFTNFQECFRFLFGENGAVIIGFAPPK
jgi:hypothetical protein